MSDGWLTHEPRLLRLLVDNQPPRRYTLFDQFREDAHSLRASSYWLIGLAFVVLGLAQMSLIAILMGVLFLGFMYFLMRKTIDLKRNCALMRGIIVDAHDWYIPFHVYRGSARLANGEDADVSFESKHMFRLLREDGALEVLCALWDEKGFKPGVSAHCVIGCRRVVRE